jgi:hypothetical protein
MRSAILAVAVPAVCVALGCLSQRAAPVVDDKPAVQFDVNDVSFLWPAPTKKEDVASLISVEEKLADDKGSILPQAALDALLDAARKVSVTDSADRENKITLEEGFSKRSAWKIAGVRVDPSAPGTAPMLIEARGSLPQVRLIIQPVTVTEMSVQVHDVTAHLVFNYHKEFKEQKDGKPPIAVPDREKFAAIVKDLAAIKEKLKSDGVATEGKLNVHPGFTDKKAKDFAAAVKSLLRKHLAEERLGAMAFMGLDPPEPWIFFAMQKQKDGKFTVSPIANAGNKSAQMLILRGGRPVMPRPTTTNVDDKKKRGVSTAPLFPDDDGKAKLDVAVFDDLAELTHKEIPDLIANPRRAHFFNTDCVSCHTESNRRSVLKIAAKGTFAYKLPPGVSGIDDKVLPKTKWNVRNFGWFPTSRTAATATATQRTANEAAESAEFINKEYLAAKK